MKFTDYFKPRWKHSNPKIRAEAIKDMDMDYNLDDLVFIAISDELAENRKIALKKISDEDALVKIIQTSDDTVIKINAGKKLDELRIKNISRSGDIKDSLSLVDKIENPKHLEDLAISSNELSIREKCFEKLNHPNSFFKIAMKEKTSSLALKALEKVTKPAHLESLSKKAQLKAVRISAKERLSPGSEKNNTAAEQKITEAKYEMLLSQYSSLLPTSNWVETQKKAAEIEDAWNSLFSSENQPPDILIQKFDNARKNFINQYNEYQHRLEEKKELATPKHIIEKQEICDNFASLLSNPKNKERDEQIEVYIDKWNSLQITNEIEADKILNHQYNQLVQKFRKEPKAETPVIEKELQPDNSRDELINNLFQQIKELFNAEESQDISSRFEDINRKWKNIGNIKEHELSVEFDNLANEIQVRIEQNNKKQLITQQQNIEELRRLVPQLEALIDNPDLFAAENDFKDLSYKWKSLTSFGKPKDEVKGEFAELAEKFQKASDQFREAQEWLRWANLNKKQELCEKLESLLSDSNDSKAMFEKFRELQVEWKAIGPVSWDSSKDVWDKYRKLSDEVYEKCQDYFSELEEERKSNLKKKEELCLVVEQQADTKNWRESSEIIKEAQSKWKDIGPVPREFSDSIWEKFRNSCDSFFNSRKSYFSNLEKDKDENLGRKIELCELLESLQDSTNWKETTEIFKKAQDDWKNIGPVPKDNIQDLWERFRKSCDYFFNKREEYFKDLEGKKDGNLEKKEALITQVENLDQIENEAEKFNFIKKIQAEWKTIGPVEKEKAEELWERFRQPIDAYFEERKGKFEENQKERLENLQKKEELCEQAMELAESKSWRGTSEKLKNLQAAWKNIGPAPREQDKEVWQKFRRSCDNFFNNMKEHYRQLDDQRALNLRSKEDICFQADVLAGFEVPESQDDKAQSLSWQNKSNTIRELQKEWKRIGPVPKSKSDELWDKFRKACDFVFENARSEESGESMDFEANLAAKVEICEEAERISKQVHTDSQIQKIKDLQRKWKSIGSVDPAKYSELWTSFKNSCNVVFQADERLDAEP